MKQLTNVKSHKEVSETSKRLRQSSNNKFLPKIKSKVMNSLNFS